MDYIEGAKPSKAKLQTVVEAFDEAPVEGYQESEGINLHITVDEKIEEQTTTDEVDLPILRNEYKNTNGKGHHYGLAVVDAYSDGDDVGGVALRTSAAFTFQKSSYPPDGYAYTHMEAAFMHELGHSLGISSDVYDGVDSKSKSFSEYPSVMNYNHKTYSEGVGTQQDPLQYSDGEGHDDWGYIEMTFSQPPTHNLD